MPELSQFPTTSAQVRDYLNSLSKLKNEIKYPELTIEKLDKSDIKLYHISDSGVPKIVLTEELFKIYQEL